jgi:hypothetical protein
MWISRNSCRVSVMMIVRSGVCTISMGYGEEMILGTPLGRQFAVGSNSGDPARSAASRFSKNSCAQGRNGVELPSAGVLERLLPVAIQTPEMLGTSGLTRTSRRATSPVTIAGGGGVRCASAPSGISNNAPT